MPFLFTGQAAYSVVAEGGRMNSPSAGSGDPTVDGTVRSCPGRERLEHSVGSARCAGPAQNSRFPLLFKREQVAVLTIIAFPLSTLTPTKRR